MAGRVGFLSVMRKVKYGKAILLLARRFLIYWNSHNALKFHNCKSLGMNCTFWLCIVAFKIIGNKIRLKLRVGGVWSTEQNLLSYLRDYNLGNVIISEKFAVFYLNSKDRRHHWMGAVIIQNIQIMQMNCYEWNSRRTRGSLGMKWRHCLTKRTSDIFAWWTQTFSLHKHWSPHDLVLHFRDKLEIDTH